jgi:UPF0716 family protein affecting phage T7 exclusion
LEKLLDDKKEVLRRTEDILQREMINRSALETKKLELMSDLSQLKLRQAAIEKENMELRRKLSKTMQQIQMPITRESSLAPQMTNGHPQDSFGTLPKRPKAPLETHFHVKNEFGNKAVKTKKSKMSTTLSGSAPSLVSNELILGESSSDPLQKSSSASEKQASSKPTGLRKIFGKMRRSNSGSLHDEKRKLKEDHSSDRVSLKTLQGYRASDGSRFSSWMATPAANINAFNEPSAPFEDWNIDLICTWIESLGLSVYTSEVKKIGKTGSNLLAMSGNDLDIKLGVKNCLHRKKLLLALRSKNPDCQGGPEKTYINLDHHWVVRWLDDIGLPQYKDKFLEGKIDGQMLNLLTTEDLCQIKITNLLHHLSLKRGIQILRKYCFDPGCLKRRSPPLTGEDEAGNPGEVALWTNHRVMEWLRSANLSEYAPNLRGSGVHGALMVFEPTFTSDLLAALLSIPSHKTLLRRHLNLHFCDLVGKSVMQSKRKAETQPNHQPLTSTTKVKHPKKNQFTLTRRRNKSASSKGDIDLEDLVCPFESNAGGEPTAL